MSSIPWGNLVSVKGVDESDNGPSLRVAVGCHWKWGTGPERGPVGTDGPGGAKGAGRCRRGAGDHTRGAFPSIDVQPLRTGPQESRRVLMAKPPSNGSRTDGRNGQSARTWVGS